MPCSPHPDDGIEIEGKDRKQAWAVWAVMVIIMTAINVSVWLYFQHRQNHQNHQQMSQVLSPKPLICLTHLLMSFL